MKIAIVGSHGVGKTSLMNKLAGKIDFIGYEFYPEAIREITKLNFPCNEGATDCSQLAMLALHLLHLRQENMVTDRCILDNYIYAYMLRDKGCNISDICVNILQRYFIESINKYDIYAFCPVQFDLKDDGFRMTDKQFQDNISEEILRTLIKYIPEDKYLLLMGETDERVKQLIEFKKAKEKSR